MRVIENTTINASADTVFNIISDYERWPEFLTVNKKVIFLEEANGKRYYEVCHLRKGELIRSICIREIVSKEHIRFELSNPNFNYLKGEWIIESGRQGVNLISVHDFELRIPYVPGVLRNLIGYFLVKRLFFDRTTPITLREIKARAENIERNKTA